MEQGTILLVDDNPQLLAVMAGLLRPLGYSVVSALSGQAALNLAAAHPPDLVLLDVMMPDMDGFAVTRAIREHPLLAQLPIILVTALDDRDSRVRGFEAGADDFITKPFDYVELRARIATILRLNRYRRLLDEQARVAAERARFVWAVEQSADGVLIVGPDDRPRYANPRARLLLGLPAVTIRLDAAAGDALAISIADDGPGLTADLLTLAWRPYYQGERSFTGQIEGMGLGLPLVARIVHGVGGRYAIANRDDAQGTVVTLTLPLASAQLQALSRQPEPPPEPSPGPGDPAA
jgi:CheY-like chemotaxis protein